MSLEDIKRKRNETATQRDQAIQDTQKLLKERNTKKLQAKKVDKKKAPAAASKKEPVQKNQPKQKGTQKNFKK